MTSNYSKYWQRFVLIIGVTVFINVMYFIYNGNNLFSANDRIRQMTMEDSGDSSKVALPEEHSNSNATKPVKNAGCVSKRVFTKGLPATALASFPGSGNTWVRYLLEQSTGYHSGSQHYDPVLKKKFPGEGRTDGSVIAVKTHARRSERYERAIVLMRNPRDALLAEFHRRHSSNGHVGLASAAAFKSRWQIYFNNQSPDWLRFSLAWVTDFKGPLHILRFEELKSDLRETLRRTLQFLGMEINETWLDCAVRDSEGIFHRPKSTNAIDPFTKDMLNTLDESTKQVEQAILDRLAKQKPSPNIT